MARYGTQPANSGAMVRIGPILALPSVLRNLGADPKEVLAEAGFDLALFDDPDNPISVAARGHMLAHCAARIGCPHLGLLMVKQAGLNALGLVGMLVKYSPDVGTALRGLVKFLHLQVCDAETRLETAGQLAILSYGTLQPGIEAATQIADGAIGIMYNIMRSLCGPGWKPKEVRFTHGKPDDVLPYRNFFHAPLVFDSDQNAVVFAGDWLSRPLCLADPDLHRLLLKQIAAIEVRYADDFPAQVRSLLRPALLTGQARSDRIAALFSMHSRTLSRRLNDCGTSFQALLDEGRFEIARQMLEDPRIGVNQIAMTLDYADSSAFTRAFRRWSGTTPAQWRENHRSDK